jgi:hypothetical protein
MGGKRIGHLVSFSHLTTGDGGILFLLIKPVTCLNILTVDLTYVSLSLECTCTADYVSSDRFFFMPVNNIYKQCLPVFRLNSCDIEIGDFFIQFVHIKCFTVNKYINRFAKTVI